MKLNKTKLQLQLNFLKNEYIVNIINELFNN